MVNQNLYIYHVKVLVVAATKMEVAPLLEYFKLPDQDFLETPGFDLLITGVGIAATAFALGQHLKPGYELVLNVGIAGSFDRSIALGELVQVSTDIFAELGAEDGDRFISIDELGFGKSVYHSSGQLQALRLNPLKQVTGITVNTVHGDSSSIALIINRLAPQTESMEGAAVFYACEKSNLPVLQIRAISNYVESRNKDQWEVKPAINHLNKWLVGFLNSLPKP